MADRRRLLQVTVHFDFVLEPENEIRESSRQFWKWLLNRLPGNSGVVAKPVTIMERFPDGRSATHAHSTGACLLYLKGEEKEITRDQLKEALH